MAYSPNSALPEAEVNGRGLVQSARPGSGRNVEPQGGLAACQSGCGRGRSWLCSSLKMAAQPPSGIRLSAVSSRGGEERPGSQEGGRVAGRASEAGVAVGGGDSPGWRGGRGSRRGRGPGAAAMSLRSVRAVRLGRAAAPGPAPWRPPAVVGAAPSSVTRPGVESGCEPRGLAGGGQGCRATRFPHRFALRGLAPRRRGQPRPGPLSSLGFLGSPARLLQAVANTDEPF